MARSELWELHGRQIAAGRPRAWRVAVRLGPDARGDASNYIQRVDDTPPAVPLLSPPEVVEFLDAPTHVAAPQL